MAVTHGVSNHVGTFIHDIDGLVQEIRYPTVNALELRLSCTDPSI